MIFLHFWIVTPQILSAVNQGKLAGGIAQSGTLLAYQMERLPPRRVQVSNNEWAYMCKKCFVQKFECSICMQATARDVSSKLGCGGQLTKATLSCLQVQDHLNWPTKSLLTSCLQLEWNVILKLLSISAPSKALYVAMHHKSSSSNVDLIGFYSAQCYVVTKQHQCN